MPPGPPPPDGVWIGSRTPAPGFPAALSSFPHGWPAWRSRSSQVYASPARSAAAGTSAKVTAPLAATTSAPRPTARSEEHTSELQSRLHLVCRLLLEKKKKHI